MRCQEIGFGKEGGVWLREDGARWWVGRFSVYPGVRGWLGGVVAGVKLRG